MSDPTFTQLERTLQTVSELYQTSFRGLNVSHHITAGQRVCQRTSFKHINMYAYIHTYIHTRQSLSDTFPHTFRLSHSTQCTLQPINKPHITGESRSEALQWHNHTKSNTTIPPSVSKPPSPSACVFVCLFLL